MYQEKNDLKNALKHFEISLKLNDKIYEPYCNIGNIYSKKFDHLKATNYYKKSISLNPNCEQAWAQLAYNYAHISDWNELEKNKKTLYKIGLNDIAIDPFSLLFFEDSPEKQLLRAKIYSNNTFVNGKSNWKNKVKKIKK